MGQGRRGWSVRGVVALLLTVATLCACQSAPSAADAKPELWSNFRDKANAESLPLTFDSGQPAVPSYDQRTAMPFIADGAYTFKPEGEKRAAAYYQGQLSGVVDRVRIKFDFTPGATTGGVMAFAILHEPQMGARIPSMSAHLTVSVNDWNYGIWDGPNNGNTMLQSVGYGRFNPPLAMNVEHTVDVVIDGDTAMLTIDGETMPPIADSRIGDSRYNGPHIFFECFSTVAATDNRTRFLEVEAWSSGQR